MKVPFYSYRNKEETYENNNYTWIDLDVFLNILDENTLEKFWKLDGFHLDKINDFKKDFENMPPISIKWDNFVSFDKFIMASKIFFMTGFTCKYGLWKKWTGTHHGVDLILPKNTPIVSFIDGKVVRIKKWDGKKKNEWNCVVIESVIDGEKYFLAYEHLEKINVSLYQEVKKDDIIWTCGSTWNSTTEHLHFQIDKENAPYHPYWWANDTVETINKYCIDGWDFLRKYYKKNNQTNTTNWENNSNNSTNNNSENNDDFLWNLIWNLDNNNSSTNYIDFFKNAWILKWDNGNLYLDSPLTRYQIALILYRMYKKWLLKWENKNCSYNFTDTKKYNDEEFKKALDFVVCNQIIKWDKNKFYPQNKLKWEQFLAIIWRLFANIKDSTEWKWYQDYLTWAKNADIINQNWDFIWKSITRKEVFQILFKLINL